MVGGHHNIRVATLGRLRTAVPKGGGIDGPGELRHKSHYVIKLVTETEAAGKVGTFEVLQRVTLGVFACLLLR